MMGALLLAATLAAVSSLAVAAPAAVAASGAASPCAAAAQQLQSGKLTLREVEALGARLPGTADCAPERTAIGALSAAQQLFKAGLTAQGDAEIVRALDALPLLKLPAGLIPATGQSAAQGPQGAAGQSAAPTSGGPWHIVQWAWAHLSISLSAAVLLALLLKVVPWLYPRLRDRLHIQQFTLGDAGTVGLDPAGFRKQVIKEIERLADERARTEGDRGLRLDIASPYESQLDVHSVTDSLGPLGPHLGRFLGWMFNMIPGRCRLLTGVMRPKISVELEIATVHGKVAQGDSEVISHDDLDMPDPSAAADPGAVRFAQLATAAAAWIILARYKSYNLGGTGKWRSFAQFVAGCAWQDAGDLAKAKEMYAAACATDSENIAAAHNLATLQLLHPDTPESVRAGRRRLQSVLAATKDEFDNPQWYRSRHLYPLVTLAAAQRAGGPGADPAEVDLASKTALELAIRVEETSLEREARAPGDQGRMGEVPTGLVKNGHGAVLALAASFLIPTTTDPTQVISDPPDGQAEDQDTVLGLLYQAANRPPGTAAPGAAEKLAAFAADRCEPTPQLEYNLYRFQRQRVIVCDLSIAGIHAALEAGTIQRTEQVDHQLRQLQETRERAEAAMADQRRAVETSGDRLLLVAVESDGPGMPDEAAGDLNARGARRYRWQDAYDGGDEPPPPADGSDPRQAPGSSRLDRHPGLA